jgi:hypothetical protein
MIDIDEQPLTIGKYIGYSSDKVAAADPEYLVWLYDNSEVKPCTKHLRDLCEMDILEEQESLNDYENDMGY